MNKTEQAQQLRLTAEILETGHPFEVQFPNSSKWGRSPHISPDVQVVNNCKIRLTLATPPDGRPLHNPDDLTAEQVGAGWRLFLPEEVDCRHGGKCELWCDDEWLSEEIEGGEHGITYRVPLSVPWPEAPKQEPAFQLPPPPPSMKWHREDGWKEGDLPQGYRPLVKGERIQLGDEGASCDGFTKFKEIIGQYPFEKARTTRPLVFIHEGKEWTWHRPGDPMPCDRFSRIEIVCVQGSTETICGKKYTPRAAQINRWDETIGWRYAETTKTVPLGPEDVLPGSVFRHKGDDGYIAPTSVFNGGIYSHDEVVFLLNFQHLMSEFQINRSIPLTGKWDANAWALCSKEVPA